jgi:hypothetical protein
MPFDAITLAEELNRSCHCITVDRVRLRQYLESGPISAGVYAAISERAPTLFSDSAVFLAGAHLEHMRAVIGAIESVVSCPGFHAWALELAAPIAHHDHGPRGVFLGYDFHLGHDGPQLIEINTNAGGGLLNAALARAQQACCATVEAAMQGAHDPHGVEDRFLAMFRAEWRRQRDTTPLRTIAIVDDAPVEQYLYPEFLLFQQLFEQAGVRAVITDPRQLIRAGGALQVAGEPIDMVYNRLTDFSLSDAGSAALRGAYAAGEVVVTPNPHIYALYADKRHLTVLSDPERLRAWGVDPAHVDLLAASVPRTRLVDASDADALWRDRKHYFFKPLDGYGGKAAYRGDKLSRKVFEQILARPYVAQRLVPPSERTIAIDGRHVPLKLDLRNYVYDAEVQLVAARLYQGQTTNFRTPGGGFAPVFTERVALDSTVDCN